MAASESIARVERLSKRFIVNKDKSLRGRLLALGASRRHREDFWALRDVDLDVEAGKTVGIVGHNGSGKSTLLKSIGGVVEPTSGLVWRRGRLAALLELGAGFHPDLTGRENVFLNAAILGLTRRETVRHFDAMVDFSGVSDFIDTQVKFYSSGMFVRLAFAVAVHSDPDLLLVDEVLAVGDEPYQRKCLDKIAEFQKDGRSILLVSHRQDQVRQLCDRVAVLDRGILTHDGDTATGLAVLKAQYKARAPRVGVTPEVAGEKSHAIAGVETRVTQSAGEPGLSATVVVDVIKARVAWDLVLTLRTASGIVLVSIKASDYGSTPPATTGRHAVTVRFAQIPLAAGDYVLDAAVVGTGGVVIDRVNGAGAFDLSHLSAGEGLLRLSAMVEYDSPTDA